jgi:hypothetical protein
MSQYYEIVSYCDVMPSDADRVISLLDRKKCIKYRLYKHHMNKVIMLLTLDERTLWQRS